MAFVSQRKRFWIIVSVLLCVAACVGYRLVVVHLNLVELNIRDPRYWFTKEIRGLRGGIYSSTCGRQPFACSLPIWEYRVDPQGLNLKRHSRESVVQTVAQAMGMDAGSVRELFWKVNSRYIYLGTTDRDDVHKIMSDTKRVTGIAIEDRQVRRYPQGTMLAHTLGFVSRDRNGNPIGMAGLEQEYERYLNGKPGRVKGMRDGRRNEIRERRVVDVDPTPGANIYLTVDHNVQYEVERALYDGFTNCQAKAGWAIVLDARKGAILAMATCPTFDPAKGTDPVNYIRNPKTTVLDFKHYNRCISENHEPGSVMKTITACAVLNEGMVGPDTLINTDRYDPDYYRLPGDTHGWDPVITVREGLVRSSNIVYGKLGYRLGPRKLSRYFNAFGFGKRTGIDLPREEAGILPPWKKWDKMSWSRAAIGQFVSVTPIQMVMAYGAVANGGKLMKPYIVDRVIAPDGEVLLRNGPVVVGQPITPETARRVREMMLGVASRGGTARRAAVKGYSVAGKTGTAQMREGKGYSDTRYNASFVGILPASDPSIVILVTYQSPEYCRSYKRHEETGLPLYNHQGGVCAAPVFSRIATSVSRYLGIEPDRQEELVEE